jgi:hypothetical protein
METSGSRSPLSSVADPAEVGPVLTPGPLSDAIIAAIRASHEGVKVIDRGAYLRVLVPGRCQLEVVRVEAILRGSFRLPGDLEAIMPSFRGQMIIASDQVTWQLFGSPLP